MSEIDSLLTDRVSASDRNFSRYERAVLAKIAERDRLAANLKTPEGADRWTLEEIRIVKQHGAPWSIGLIDDEMPERIRGRFRRAFTRLAKDGLLITFAETGNRVTNVKLSEAGRRVAKRLGVAPADAEETPAADEGASGQSEGTDSPRDDGGMT